MDHRSLDSIANLPILWMDDKPEHIKDYVRTLEVEKSPISVEVSTSIADAERKLKQKKYLALVIDCQMDDNDRSQNGADFLLDINAKIRTLPTFVYTAFRTETLYKESLERSYAIAIAEKTDTFETPLHSNPFFAAIIRSAQNFLEVKDLKPEKIQFERYIADPNSYKSDVEAHWQRHKNWITKEIARIGWIWGVVCGENIVAGSADLFDFPTEEELMKIGKSNNLIPFAYSFSHDPEMSELGIGKNLIGWSMIAEKDYFPTFRLTMAGNEITDDFDTGAHQTQVSDDLIPKGILDAVQSKNSLHLGESYSFFTKKIDVKVSDNDLTHDSRKIAVRIIRDWVNSPFVKINKNRRALIGRDILRAFDLRVLLDSHKKETQVLLGNNSNQKWSTLYPLSQPYNEGWLQVSRHHNLSFEESGNKNGKPVLVLHGGPGAGRNVNNRRFFNPDRYRIILYDQRGSGKSIPLASLEENTTWDLVEDIEMLRKHLRINKWQVFGGSWGSTLALAYAQNHPTMVTELVLRGIFLLRQWEINWFYQQGANVLFPDAWEDYLAPIKEEDRGDMVLAYNKLLTRDNLDLRLSAARAWATWEARLNSLVPNPHGLERLKSDEFCLSFSRIENHFFLNKGFFNPENQLLNNVDKIKHIPTTVIHGRHDIICPIQNAWDLKQIWQEIDLRIVEDACHSAFEPGIMQELILATEKYSK